MNLNNLTAHRERPTRARALLAVAALAILTAVQLLASCGGGGFDGGISGTGVTFGPITGFGSIIVNDIEFDVDGATVVLNGAPASASDLRLGMLVTVRGQRNSTTGTGVAESVDFDNVLRGPIEAVDVGSRTVQVLAQTARTNAGTVFEGITLATAAPGDIVEVSGFVDAAGIVLATRVEFQPASTIFEIEGTIAQIDLVAETFFIGMLQIDYSTADIEDAPPTGLANGLFVEVEAFTAPVGGLLIAVEVEVEDGSSGGEEGEDAEIKGFVTQIVSPTQFVLNGTQNVVTSAATEYDDGTPADLIVNAEVEVKGTFGLDGTLLASKVKFEEDD